jgi:hypothetical protein
MTAKARYRKEQSRHARELRKKARDPDRRAPSDRAIYFGMALVGFFFVMLAGLFTENWLVPAVLYIVFIAWMINSSALYIYRGKQIPHWQQSLAKIPLRPVGFGTRGGKPLEAAHHQPAAQKAVLTSFFVSLFVIAVLVAVMVQSWNH